MLKQVGRIRIPGLSRNVCPGIPSSFFAQRHLGTGTGTGSELETTKSSSISQAQKALAIGGVLGITYVFYDLTFAFLNLTPALSLKFGFFGGVASTAVAGAVLYGFDTYLHTRPDKAYWQGAQLALQNKGLKDVLGGSLQLDRHPIKAYRTSQGVFSLLSLKSPQTEMLFHIKGMKGTATVYIHSTHSLIFHKAKVLSCQADVQLQSGKRDRLVLAGTEDNDKFNSLLKDASRNFK